MLPDFETVFRHEAYRLRGISGWDQVPELGRENIERLLLLARESALAVMADGGSTEERRPLKTAIDYLGECLPNSVSKPRFPRLRVESFHKGEDVRIYMGDSVGSVAPEKWVSATITARDKSHRTDWNDGSANGGYFWRWTATAASPFFPGQDWLRFSTSEPRVLPVSEFEYLKQAAEDDPEFLKMFAENAWRTWEPLWCIERETHSSGGQMNMKAWITESID
jgi:hypothetical protein